MLNREHIERYRADGYLLIERLLDPDAIAGLRHVTDDFVESSRAVTASDDVFDLDPSHRAEAPCVRRIKDPTLQHPAYDALMRSDAIVDIVEDLIGPAIRFDHAKLNFKPSGGGAAVEWHQDWAFYPHTNDDLLAVGVMLDDCTDDNGPLLVVPGSHQGPLWNHHDAEGYFCGALDPAASDLDYDATKALTGPAGSISIHHVRMVHGSRESRSSRPRRLLLLCYAATDAWPLMGSNDHRDMDLAHFDDKILRGEPTLTPRIVPTPVRIPLPRPLHEGSIYENQSPVQGRSFGKAATS
ncbi:MAG: phytanoyl-CoA dioxygenase family protein [Proteobacteria bacterium]|nr:phytanoyl-CoA dioxygenase family protein [Pseudomonadota bacterium]